MKRNIFTLGFSIIICSSCFTEKKETRNAYGNSYPSSGKIVYICTGPYAEKYHKSKICSGLSNCSGTIEAIGTVADALDANYDDCARCY